MKYGLIPTDMVERLALASGKVPVPLLDAVFGPLKARAIMAGVTLGLFEAMREGEHTAASLAGRLGLDAEALEILLRALVLCEYAVQRGARFELSPLARSSMLEGAPMALVGYMRFNYRQWEFFEHLEELVRTGRGVDFHETMTAAEDWRDYQQGMLEIARIEAPVVAPRVRVRPGAASLLDLAGSHGLFGAAICRKHPPLRATVLELPQAIEHAAALAQAEGIADVVTHRAGDLLTADFGRDHDVVLLANILHHFARELVAAILGRAHAALRADGTIAIWEVEGPKRGSRVTGRDAAALLFRLTSTAGAYHGDEYADWLRHAGFRRVTVARPARTPGKVLVTGRR